MAEPIFSLLHGQTGVRLHQRETGAFCVTRPEILIPLRRVTPFAPRRPVRRSRWGAVRVVRPPYLGAVGVIEEMVAKTRR